MNVRASDWSPTPPDPDEGVVFCVPQVIAMQDELRLERLVRELGFEDHRTWELGASGRRRLRVRRWTLDVVNAVVAAVANAALNDLLRDATAVYPAVRRALRACVDTEFRKAFWSARLLGGYEAAGAYLLANAPKRRVNRTAKDVREALDAAWRLHDPDALQPILDALNRIPPGCSDKVNGYAVRRGKQGGNEHRWWISHPYLGRELSLPGEPRRLLRPLWEAALLATMGAGRPRRPPRR